MIIESTLIAAALILLREVVHRKTRPVGLVNLQPQATKRGANIEVFAPALTPSAAQAPAVARKSEPGLDAQNPVSNEPAVAGVANDPLVLVKPDHECIKRQIASRSPVAVSTRVILIDVEAFTGLPVGTAWIYLYENDSDGAAFHKARRLLKFTNRTLAKLICKPGETRYFFPDVAYDPAGGTEAIQEAFLQEIRNLLDRKRKAVERETKRQVNESAVKAAQPVAPKVAESPPPAQPLAAPPQPSRPAPVAVPVDRSALVQEGAPPTQVAPALNLAVQGQVFEGVVVNAAQTWKTGPRGAYKVFCLTINDGKTETPLNGTELERLVRDNNIQIGERVRVVSMGRSPVDVPGQDRPAYKNLYQITRVGT